MSSEFACIYEYLLCVCRYIMRMCWFFSNLLCEYVDLVALGRYKVLGKYYVEKMEDTLEY